MTTPTVDLVELASMLPPYHTPAIRACGPLVAYETSSGLDHKRDGTLTVVVSLLADLDAWCSLHGVDLDMARDLAREVRANEACGAEL